MIFRTITDLRNVIYKNIQILPSGIDLVVGIPRSGLLAAHILALYLNLPLTDVDGLIEGRLIESGRRLKSENNMINSGRSLKVLVLDDSIQSGRQIKEVKRKIGIANLPHKIIYGTVYASANVAEEVDIYFQILPTKRLYEWNVFHHRILKKSCVDIDGVLCRNPTENENDDAENYLDFIMNVEPFIIPSVPIGWLVTCRLEKYRAHTVKWLEQNGVKYDELIMMNLPSKISRINTGSHADFKAEVYIRTQAKLFIESSLRQSRKIAAITRKPVLCVDNLELIDSTRSGRNGIHNAIWLAFWMANVIRNKVVRIEHKIKNRVLKTSMIDWQTSKSQTSESLFPDERI